MLNYLIQHSNKKHSNKKHDLTNFPIFPHLALKFLFVSAVLMYFKKTLVFREESSRDQRF